MRSGILAAALLAVLPLMPVAAFAADEIRSERVTIAQGANAATVEASITGYQIVDYLLSATKGQYMNVSMATQSTAAYFNILAPGETEVAFFNGSISQNQFEGTAPESGDYRIRVYQMRSAARRGEVADYRLEMIVGDAGEDAAAASSGAPAAPEDGGTRYWTVSGVSTSLNLRAEPSTSAATIARYRAGTVLNNLGCREAGGRAWCDVQEVGGGPRGFVAAEFLTPTVAPHGAVLTGADDSALRAGQGQFDATGKIPCAEASGAPMGQCDFGVARGGGGDATVVVTRANGRTRAIFFSLGRPIGADTSEADPGEFSATRDNDLHMIRIGAERYEMPDAVVFGG